MKNKLSIFFVLINIMSFAQVQDYPFIIVKNVGGEGLNTLIEEGKEILTEKKYQVFYASQDLPQSVKLNPCTALRAELSKKNELLQIKFYDCNQTNLASWEGASMSAFYHWLPYQSTQIPNYREQETKTVSIIKTVSGIDNYDMYRTNHHQPTEQELLLIQDQAEAYTTEDGKTLMKTNLSGGEFLLSYPKTNEIYARFYPSSKAGVYHVKMLQKVGSEYHSIGFVEPNQIKVEAQRSSSTWDVHTFNKKK